MMSTASGAFSCRRRKVTVTLWKFCRAKINVTSARTAPTARSPRRMPAPLHRPAPARLHRRFTILRPAARVQAASVLLHDALPARGFQVAAEGVRLVGRREGADLRAVVH